MVVGWTSRQEVETCNSLIIFIFIICAFAYGCGTLVSVIVKYEREDQGGVRNLYLFVSVCWRRGSQKPLEISGRIENLWVRYWTYRLDLQNTKQWAWCRTICIFDIRRVFILGSMTYTTCSITLWRTGHPCWIRVSKVIPAVTVVKVHTFRYVCTYNNMRILKDSIFCAASFFLWFLVCFLFERIRILLVRLRMPNEIWV
jgi:hypothetical protein